jgi:hypothetical protein
MARNAFYVLACVAWSSSAFAYVDTVTVFPPAPTTASDVVVKVEGGLPDACWSVTCHGLKIDGGAISIAAKAESSGGICLPVIKPYSYLAHIGKLPAGTYTVEATDEWGSAKTSFEVVPQGKTVPGDTNSDAKVDISDAIFLLRALFGGGPAPACAGLADVNGDAKLNIADAVWILGYLFASGPAPVASIQCSVARDCAGQAWLIDCLGHWECVCGECRAVCDGGVCGDGYCDVAGGETPDNCPDCRSDTCCPVCLFVGTRSEGWYDPCGNPGETPKLLRYAFCAGSRAVCRNCGSKSEGWYDSATGELIEYADCDCECE